MSAPIERLTRPGDEPQLREIWAEAYAGDPACADAWFRLCHQPENGVVTEEDGVLCSAIYRIPGYLLKNFNGENYTADYLYALGTRQSCRGRGMGGATIRRAGEESARRGGDFCCFLPASAGLARWYAEILGTVPRFFRRTGTVTRGAAPEGSVKRISPEEYHARREELLQGHPHAAFPLQALQLQEACSELYGGGLFCVEGAGGCAVCVADLEEDCLILRELLPCGTEPETTARQMMQALGGSTAQVRMPVFFCPDFGTVTEDAVVIPGKLPFPATEELPYWGPAMD